MEPYKNVSVWNHIEKLWYGMIYGQLYMRPYIKSSLESNFIYSPMSILYMEQYYSHIKLKNTKKNIYMPIYGPISIPYMDQN